MNDSRRHTRTRAVLGFAALLLFMRTSWSAELNLADVPGGGLAVVAGGQAETHALKLAATGRWLVRVVPGSAETATALAKATARLHPLVTVGDVAQRLPFAEDSVNLVILGTGAAIPLGEAQRVLAPGGVLLSESNGSFKAAVEPVDPRFAPWTHWQADEFASGSSNDAAVGPSNRLRWWSQSIIGAQVRTIDGVVAVLEDAQGGESRGNEFDRDGLQGLDAFSGVPLWYRTGAVPDGGYARTIIVAHPLGFVHTQNGDDKPAVLTDRRSGTVRISYDQGLRFKGKEEAGTTLLVVHGDLLIQCLGTEIVALNVPTGQLVWKKKLENLTTKAVVSRDGQRLYVAEIQPANQRSYLRWGSYRTVAIAALNLADGNVLWRNGEFAQLESTDHGKKAKHGGVNVSELLEFDGSLFAYDQVSNIGGDNHGDLFAMDPATGAIRWHYSDTNGKVPGQKEYEKHGPMLNNILIWNDGLWADTRNFSTKGPTQTAGDFINMTGNARCVRYSASANYLLLGFNSFIGKDFTSYQTGLTRGNCAMPNYATHGALISVTDETCSCYNGLRGQTALIPESPITPISENERLTQPAAIPADAPSALPPESPVIADWIPFPSLRLFPAEVPPVEIGGMTLQVDTQRHLVTALKAGAPVWRYCADGRVFTAPVGGPDGIYVASAGGTVTCLDKNTGAPRWRFMAAPQPDYVVINGQLESRWPVYNTLLKDGRVYFVAGRHAELDGGLWLWALDAKSGAVQQRCRLFLPVSVVKRGERPNWARARSSREVASRGVLCGGIDLNEKGQICLVNRWWLKSGSRPCSNGYWYPQKVGEGSPPDFTKPTRWLEPLDLAAWNGKTLDPITAFSLHKGENIRKSIPWVSPFAE